mmetsp:Transcript_22298/g.60914  ORF Transcript_22298/g.60914 Transcript_22298/m.60914 type:complete len:213 (-) Transcript_22298:277-915(-)
MNPRVWDEVGLELRDVHVQCAIEAQGGGQRRDDLRQQSVQVGVRGPLNVKIAAADVIEGLVVVHDRDVGVLQQGVHAEDRVVGLHNRGGDLRARPDGEGELRLLAVVHGQALQHQAAQSRARTTSAGVVDHEPLQARAVVGQLADPVQDQVHDLLAYRVMAARKVVGRVLFSRDELLGMEELAVRARANLIDYRRLQVHEDAPRHVLAGARL